MNKSKDYRLSSLVLKRYCVFFMGSSVSHVIGGTRQADEGMTAAL